MGRPSLCGAGSGARPGRAAAAEHSRLWLTLVAGPPALKPLRGSGRLSPAHLWRPRLDHVEVAASAGPLRGHPGTERVCPAASWRSGAVALQLIVREAAKGEVGGTDRPAVLRGGSGRQHCAAWAFRPRWDLTGPGVANGELGRGDWLLLSRSATVNDGERRPQR
ncbi:hypothetical protein NDU88_004953 [Pleurodeles waltl]|uniref:Uncharacterized protein n=1 Tax=Pleurodeles waltl TaxID=8319 RepID=A0AAV7QGZ6_PLEWA|nr:hypothetical protein NDU88_004953 [Pleurodeles waltl]